MDKRFITWKVGAVRFLAVPNDRGYMILNDAGDWFGGWQSVEEFRKRVTKEGDEQYYLSKSAAFLQVRLAD